MCLYMLLGSGYCSLNGRGMFVLLKWIFTVILLYLGCRCMNWNITASYKHAAEGKILFFDNSRILFWTVQSSLVEISIPESIAVKNNSFWKLLNIYIIVLFFIFISCINKPLLPKCWTCSKGLNALFISEASKALYIFQQFHVIWYYKISISTAWLKNLRQSLTIYK